MVNDIGALGAGPRVTIGDLLADATLGLVPVVIADSDANAHVTWAHATEQVDPRPHLRPREFVCTLGSALINPRASEAFVAALADASVACVGIGVGEVHLDPPAELIAACRIWGLPLLVIPHGTPFLAVNDAILRRRSEAETEARRVETAVLSDLLHRARSGATEDQLRVEASLALSGGASEEPRGVASVRAPLAKPGPSDEFAEQFASIIEIARVQVERAAVEQRVRVGQLIEFVEQGLAHAGALVPELDARGLGAGPLQVSAWPEGSADAVTKRWPQAVIGTTARTVTMITAPMPESETQSLGLVCGYSSSVGLPQLRSAISEAWSAFTLARSRGGVAGPRDLVSLEALLEQLPTDVSRRFVERLLAPIIDADGSSRGDLLSTLRAYVAADQHVQRTADALFVHVNTVRHRLGRIREVSGRDPMTLSGLTDLRIALWAFDRRLAVGARLVPPLR
ncbi:PucR family transcriptional regulator [Leucobacter sp. USHLN154]|uniref:PucR family transcriptional regulator n=1 Tax=Leucobacter sp. USHLN154 TaxID=3081269 RepID=UPI003019F357